MKKILLILMMSLLLIGCGGKPNGMSDEMYDTGIYVVDVVDRYLDGTHTLEYTYSLIDSVNVPECSDVLSIDWETSTHILSVKVALSGMKTYAQTATISDLKEERNGLADILNYK